MTSRAAALLQRCRLPLEESKRCTFVQQAHDGTLSDTSLARYLLVEEAFVLTASRVTGLLVWDSKTWDDIERFAASLEHLVREQREWFHVRRPAWPVVGQDAARSLERASVLSRTVLQQVRTHGRPAAVVGMFAAETLYSQWCAAAVKTRVRRQPDLQDWIELHVTPAFLRGLETLTADVDALPPQVTDAQLDQWFTTVLTAEDAFHDSTLAD